jgi:hypothetical protein
MTFFLGLFMVIESELYFNLLMVVTFWRISFWELRRGFLFGNTFMRDLLALFLGRANSLFLVRFFISFILFHSSLYPSACFHMFTGCVFLIRVYRVDMVGCTATSVRTILIHTLYLLSLRLAVLFCYNRCTLGIWQSAR